MNQHQQYLIQLNNNLSTLRKQEAAHGGEANAPVNLLNQIAHHQEAIKITDQARIGDLTETEWREALAPLLVDQPPGQPSAPPRDKNLTIMLNNVRKIWVEDYLNSALLNAIYIDLGLQEKPDAVPRPFEDLNITLRQPEKDKQDLPTGTQAIDVYRQAQGSLLILGRPGSGKTTTLATLARDLLTEAEYNPATPVPVIFNLSSWAIKQKPLANWLADELVRQYQVSRKLARSWLGEGQLALLLDGLDEVATDRREACVEGD